MDFEKINDVTVSDVNSTGYEVLIANGDKVFITIWHEHLVYTGGYGTAVMRMNGVPNIASALTPNASNDYIMSKMVADDIDGDAYRTFLMLEVIRKVAAFSSNTVTA